MDAFNYYLRKLERFPKESTVRDLTGKTLRTIQDGPELVGAEVGVSFLLALWMWRDAPDGLELLPSYRAVRQALEMELESIEMEVAAADSLRAMPEEFPEPEPDGEPEPGPELEALREDPEGPPFLTFENWPEWGAGEWIIFRRAQDETMEAAQKGLAGIGKAAEMLEGIREHVHKLPAEDRVKLTLWAVRLADEMHDRTEEAVDELGRANLYTKEGREIQRRLAGPNDRGTNWIP